MLLELKRKVARASRRASRGTYNIVKNSSPEIVDPAIDVVGAGQIGMFFGRVPFYLAAMSIAKAAALYGAIVFCSTLLILDVYIQLHTLRNFKKLMEYEVVEKFLFGSFAIEG